MIKKFCKKSRVGEKEMLKKINYKRNEKLYAKKGKEFRGQHYNHKQQENKTRVCN